MTKNYVTSKNAAAALVAEKTEAYNQNVGKGDFEQFAIATILDLLGRHPERYLSFGVYWPALKKVLNENGAALGEDLIDSDMVALYGADLTNLEIVCTAYNFRDFYYSNFAVGNRIFMIDDEELEEWSLFDLDMESKIK